MTGAALTSISNIMLYYHGRFPDIFLFIIEDGLQ